MSQPLSTYVVLKLACAGATAFCAYMASADTEIAKCNWPSGAWVGITTWLYAQMGFCVVHVFFAPYFQTRVLAKIKEDLGSGGGAGKEPGSIIVPGQKVHDSFKAVFLHDLGVLFYACVLVASFVWSYEGAIWVSESREIGSNSSCDPDSYTSQACWFGQAFFFIAVMYTGCYYLCGCCARSVELKTDGDGYSAPGQQTMPGVPAGNFFT